KKPRQITDGANLSHRPRSPPQRTTPYSLIEIPTTLRFMTQAPNSPPPGGEDVGRLEAARREKLRKIAALGVDPWGGRFDDRALIADLRARKGEIRYARELGGPIEIPDRELQPDLDFRGWMQDQGKGEWSGPKV